MISSDIIRGYTDIIILRLLYEKDSYGYEISKRITQLSEGMYSLKETTLYSAFSRLERNGHITSYSGTETQGKPRTYYTITDAGKTYFAEKCTEWAHTKTLINRFTEGVPPYEQDSALH